MINILINNGTRFIFLILFQVLVLNNIQFSGMVNPYLYILFILLLPFDTPGWVVLISSFFLGFFIDIFPQGITGNSYIIGLHASASVLAAFLRPAVLKVISPPDGYEKGTKPHINYYGFFWFIKYSVLIVFPHHLILFFLEEASLSKFLTTFMRVIFSFIFTLILIIISMYLTYRKK